jgi:hypothetical protein
MIFGFLPTFGRPCDDDPDDDDGFPEEVLGPGREEVAAQAGRCPRRERLASRVQGARGR